MRKRKVVKIEKKSLGEVVTEALEMPKELLLGVPKIIFTGNRELFVENYKGIIEYSDTIIRINTKSNVLKICGANLGIKNIAEEEITLYGNIKILEFI